MKNKKRKAFTLVELIIVITILAILATIWFMSFQTYTADARDWKRKTDLWLIRNWLEIYQAKKSVLPSPDEQTVNIMSWTDLISIQWYAWTSVLQKLRASDIKDSLDNIYYTYIVNSDKTNYQLLSMLEDDNNLVSNNFINHTYALDYTNRHAYTTWDKVWVFLSWSSNIPLQETMSWNINLSTTHSRTMFKVVFSNAKTNSWIINSNWANLPNIIQTETKIVANNWNQSHTQQEQNSCAGRPNISNASFVDWNPTSQNQAWQNTNSSNPCYYSCNINYHLDNNTCVRNILLIWTNSWTSATSSIVMSANSNITDWDLVITSVWNANNISNFSPYNSTLTEVYDFWNQARHSTYYNYHSSATTMYKITASKSPNWSYSWFSQTFRNANYISHSSIDYPNGNTITIQATNKKRYWYISLGDSTLTMAWANLIFSSTYLKIYLIVVNPNSTVTWTINWRTNYCSSDIITIEEK